MVEKDDEVNINENSYKKFVKNIGILGIAQFSIYIQAIILLPILTKVLGASDYGVWVQVGVTVTLFVTFASCGLPSAMARFLPAQKRKSEIQDGFYTTLALTISFCLILSFLIISFSDYITNSLFDGYPNIVKLLAFILPVTMGMMICTEYFPHNGYPQNPFSMHSRYSIVYFHLFPLRVMIESFWLVHKTTTIF